MGSAAWGERASFLLIVRFASGFGVSVSVALGATGSVGLLTVAVLTRLPVNAEAVWITNVNTCGPEPAASVASDAVRVPLAPTVVVSVRVHPVGTVSETKVVPTGSGSLNTTV